LDFCALANFSLLLQFGSYLYAVCLVSEFPQVTHAP